MVYDVSALFRTVEVGTVFGTIAPARCVVGTDQQQAFRSSWMEVAKCKTSFGTSGCPSAPFRVPQGTFVLSVEERHLAVRCLARAVAALASCDSWDRLEGLFDPRSGVGRLVESWKCHHQHPYHSLQTLDECKCCRSNVLVARFLLRPRLHSRNVGLDWRESGRG